MLVQKIAAPVRYLAMCLPNQFARFLPHPCHGVKEFGLAVDIGDVETLERG